MKKSLLLCLIASFIFIISCKKNTDTTSVVAKWSLIKSLYTDTTTQDQTIETFDAGSYVNFNANGVCFSYVDSINNVSNWHYIDNNNGIYIQDNNGFVSNDSGYTIQNVTSQSLILFSKKVEIGQTQTLYMQK